MIDVEAPVPPDRLWNALASIAQSRQKDNEPK
jgi:hypothetical protein